MRYFLICLVMLFVSSGMVTCSSKEKTVEAEAKSVVVTNDLPEMTLTVLNGSRVQAKALKGKIVFILFQPDCDHCQREAREIKEHLDAFRGYGVYFVSASTEEELEHFAKEYGLYGIENIRFANTTVQEVLNSFGSIPAPSVFIFNDEGKRIASFKGETEIDKIMAAL